MSPTSSSEWPTTCMVRISFILLRKYKATITSRCCQLSQRNAHLLPFAHGHGLTEVFIGIYVSLQVYIILAIYFVTWCVRRNRRRMNNPAGTAANRRLPNHRWGELQVIFWNKLNFNVNSYTGRRIWECGDCTDKRGPNRIGWLGFGQERRRLAAR